jgi:hypothetical protein
MPSGKAKYEAFQRKAMSIAPIEREYLLKKMRKEACEWRMKELAKEIDDDAAALALSHYQT